MYFYLIFFSCHLKWLIWQSNFTNFIHSIIFQVDSLGLSPAEDYKLAVRSLGAITWYLKSCHLEQQLLSMRRFEQYAPIDTLDGAKVSVSSSQNLNGRHMV